MPDYDLYSGCDEGQVQYLVIKHTLGGDRGQMEITSNQSTADSLQYAINNTVSTYGNSMVIKQMNKCAGHQTEPKCASNAGSDVVLIRYGVGSESKTNIDEMETHKSDTWKDANGEERSDCVSMEVEVDRSQLWTEKNISSENGMIKSYSFLGKDLKFICICSPKYNVTSDLILS